MTAVQGPRHRHTDHLPGRAAWHVRITAGGRARAGAKTPKSIRTKFAELNILHYEPYHCCIVAAT